MASSPLPSRRPDGDPHDGVAATVGRPRDEPRRRRLAARAGEVLVARQSCEIPLVELAAALGESSRVLVHHFGSRDALIAAALADARGRLLGRARSELDRRRPGTVPELVAAAREVIRDPAHRSAFRLFDEVNALAQTQPGRFPGFGRESVHDWLPQFAALLGPSSRDDRDAHARATLALALVRGLMLDENATDERERIDAALAALRDLR